MLTFITVANNENKDLQQCLERVEPIQRKLVFDIAHSSATKAICEQYGAEWIPVRPAPVVEYVLAENIADHVSGSNWILRLDPDEWIPAPLLESVMLHAQTADETVGMFLLPLQYYFKQHALSGTMWGGVRDFPQRFFRADALTFRGVHVPAELQPGYSIGVLGGPPIAHMWAQSYAEIRRKHARYARAEGKARAEQGRTFRLHELFVQPARTLLSNLFRRRAFADRLTGMTLALIACEYELKSQWSMRQYLRR